MQIEAAFSLSEEYYKFMSDFAQTSFEDDKLLGKFYTDFTVAKRMVETIVENVKLDVFSRDIKLIDPFCGDGRLISETIIQLIQKDIIHGRKLYISLWDIDEVAVNVAKQNVEEICNAYQLSYEIDAKKYDAFVGYQLIKGHYDICVTNPPWSLLKPQKLFNKSNNEEALEAYRVAIEKYDGFMKSEFPISQPSRKFGKWGTNLARCGTEVALRTIKFSGVCGIVSPASLFNDQVSGELRKWIFENYKVADITYYPAELKLYGKADISSCTMKAELVLELPEGEITAANAASLSGKLSQMANGAVYADDESILPIHDRKLDALEDIIESANGKPLLIAYWFKHDLIRIEQRLAEKKIPFQKLDSDASMKKWNRGELPVALIHPASAGHGLNLQSGGSTLVWFGITWSLELYQQTVARLYRQGQSSRTVTVIHILTQGTVDEKIMKALAEKDSTQSALIDAVKAEL